MDTEEAGFEAGVELDQEALVSRQAAGASSRAQNAAAVANGGVRYNTREEADALAEANEFSPLIRRTTAEEASHENAPTYQTLDDFAHLPWHKRPSIFWILGPFLVMALAFGGFLAPKLNLILELVCREYINEMELKDPMFFSPPIDFSGNGDNDQCRIPEVQQRVAYFTLYGSLIQGLLSAFTAPKLGALSDRYGRKSILVLTSIGTIIGEVITILAARKPETFPVGWLLVSYGFDGITGSFIVAMAIANSYATDCTPPEHRNVAFGYFHGAMFFGFAVGPIVAGYLVKLTHSIVTVFYAMLGAHLFFCIFIAFLVPESLSKKRQNVAREKHKSWLLEVGPEWDFINAIRSLNLLAPLAVLWPKGEGSSKALRLNLLFLAAVDTIVFGVAMGSMTVIVIYTNYQFGWKTFESARFMSIVSTCRVFCLIVVLPLATRLIRGKASARPKQRSTGSDLFDLSVIRLAVFFDTLGYMGYALSRTGPMMILSGATAAIGGIGSPTLQAALTKHVPADRTGQLLGATGLLHALARVVGPMVFNAIYSATVGKFTQTVFVCLTATFGVAFIISLFIRPHIYLDAQTPEPSPDRVHSAPGDHYSTTSPAKGESVRFPIVESVNSVASTVGANLGVTSPRAAS